MQAESQLPQKAMADKSEFDFQESMILQREQEIESLQKGIEDINDIYESLAAIVSAHGENLDDITVRVVASANDIKKAYDYLPP